MKKIKAAVTNSPPMDENKKHKKLETFKILAINFILLKVEKHKRKP